MKLKRALGLIFGTLAAGGILWAARPAGQEPDPSKPKIGGFIRTSYRYSSGDDWLLGKTFLSADEAQYKDVAPGASMAVIAGDPDKGAHRVFTKFAPAASFPLHTHTSEMRIVVIKGAYLYKPEKGEERRVGPGCYLDIPANERHSSGGDAKEGALFFEESAGKFDLVPVEVEKK